MGLEETVSPWTYADVISHTSGIDVFFDGHSHDTEQVVMKNKDGEDVVRSACGTELNCIGYSRISAEEGIVDTGIWSWPNDDSPAELFGIRNPMSEKVDAAMEKLGSTLNDVVAKTAVDLTISDPVETDAKGNPIRMVRRAETNLGDLCADACRAVTGAEVAVVNGGAVRTSIAKGDITYGDILSVFPFGNMMCVIKVTGQQIADALEWGVRNVPGESG
ncbi:MAG: 5'-nucleotidase C-terminal domain-containing protein, partial [Clostridia bacterium]|nr:5'-nucleotidase C-terminal domain-containing protein [Clostridia bacterium]